MRLHTESYQEQQARWPRAGRHILAQYDADSIVVYQAYTPSIGRFAATHGRFGGDFSYNRMSWIKPNFLWMMYRSGWGTKPSQEITLAVRIRRDAFDLMLGQAVHSSFVPAIHPDRARAKSPRRKLAKWSVASLLSKLASTASGRHIAARATAMRRWSGSLLNRISKRSGWFGP